MPMIAYDIQFEAELVERFVASYRRRFAGAIAELNRNGGGEETMTPEQKCLRLCVETMDMVLVNQDRMARALRRVAGDIPGRRAA